jgi:predicted flap endonuclease-1-like 5' DNA nuclease
MAKITDIEGIGPAYAEKIALAGIKTVEGLLKAGATPKGRRDIAEASGLKAELILDWTNMADLFRIKGVSSQYAELLKKAGVDTVKELRNRKPENLHVKMKEINEAHHLVRQLPTVAQVTAMVDQAKTLDPVITH